MARIRMLLLALGFAGLVAVAGSTGSVARASTGGDAIGAFTEYPIPACPAVAGGPSGGCSPLGITPGPDGALWFTETLGDEIGRISTAGAITQFPLPTPSEPAQPSEEPSDIAAGSDGALWFDEDNSLTEVARIGTDGSIASFSLPPLRGQPSYLLAQVHGLAIGSDGNLWFGESRGDTIDSMSLDGGSVRTFSIPTGDASPTSLAEADGDIWFTEQAANKIGRMTPSGSSSEFSIPSAYSQPFAITAGPKGSLWFTEGGSGPARAGIGMITPEGVMTEFPVPSGSVPVEIVEGPDGNLWFTDGATNSIGRITPKGVITEFPIPTPDSGPWGIAAGSDGSIWFTEENAGQIGRLVTSDAITTELSAATVVAGGSVNDTGSLSGVTADAGGTVRFRYYTNGNCAGSGTKTAARTVTDGTVPPSATVVFKSPGTYSWNAVYSGDANNGSATSACEPLTVTAKRASAITATLSASAIVVGGSVSDSASFGSTVTADAGGTVVYWRYSTGDCSGKGKRNLAVPVAGAQVPDSTAVTYKAAGSYSWQAVYSGDANNVAATSNCEPLAVAKKPPA